MALMSKVTSFKKVLRQHGFYAVRGTKDRPLFMKHDEKFGGLYVDLSDFENADFRVHGADFKHTFANRRELKNFLKNLDYDMTIQMTKSLNRTRIREILKSYLDSN